MTHPCLPWRASIAQSSKIFGVAAIEVGPERRDAENLLDLHGAQHVHLVLRRGEHVGPVFLQGRRQAAACNFSFKIASFRAGSTGLNFISGVRSRENGVLERAQCARWANAHRAPARPMGRQNRPSSCAKFTASPQPVDDHRHCVASVIDK
jgi:hypothetical protein